jgi:hypothetical protein
MVRRVRLELTAEQRDRLIDVRDHDPHPQMRERCAALLKIADGMAPYRVAREGLLKPKDPDAVYRWVRYYQQAGLPGVRAHLHGGSTRGRLRRRSGAGTDAVSPGSGGSA